MKPIRHILVAISTNNQYYFNIQLKEFSNPFTGIDLFCIKVVVKNSGFVVFSKITEPYRLIPNKGQCKAIIDSFAWMIISKAGFIDINGLRFEHGQGLQNAGYEINYADDTYYINVKCSDNVKIGYCYKGDDVLIDVPLLTDSINDEIACGLVLYKLEGIYNCSDFITGHYYGDAKILLNYSKNNPQLRYKNSFYVYGEINPMPTEIQKNSSFYGKPQRVEYVPKFEFIGLEVFPVWKMLEIESIFGARRVYIQGKEYIYRGGKIFEKDDISNTCSWKLNAKLEGIPKVNDFSCVESCSNNCTYFVIPSGNKNQNYFDEEKNLIATNYDELLTYFKNMPDIISVDDMPLYEHSCDVTAIIKINSFGIIPSFIYYRLANVENRIFAKLDDCLNPQSICNGLSSCNKPSGIYSKKLPYVGCAEIPSGITSSLLQSTAINYNVSQYYDSWTAEKEIIIKEGNIVSLDFVLSNPNITDGQYIENSQVILLPTEICPKNIEIIDIYDGVVIINTDGIVEIAGGTTNNKITFTSNYTTL